MILAYRPCFMYLLVLLTGTDISDTQPSSEQTTSYEGKLKKGKGGKEGEKRHLDKKEENGSALIRMRRNGGLK
jgi:hypothetical protein